MITFVLSLLLTFGQGICLITASSKGSTELCLVFYNPLTSSCVLLTRTTLGKSSCHSSAPSSNIKSKTCFVYFFRRTVFFVDFIDNDYGLSASDQLLFAKQNGFEAWVPQKHRQVSKTPSAMLRTRSTSPPKSA